MAPSGADDDFETHEWKSEFASHRSGRNSPNIFAKVRRKLLLTPPVRNVRSPRFTDEELDALTGDLPYATNYTYAYSKCYDPSLPDHWEVPNLAGGPSAGFLAEQEHWSAASLGRQLFYLLRLPLFLVVHFITYILEAIYHVIKISTYTFWDFIVYLIRVAKTRYEAWQDHRRRTFLVRNRQDPFKVKAARFIASFFEFLSSVMLAPFRLFSGSKSGVEQYEYKSIKDQLENERASRMLTRSQAAHLNRRVADLSQSPSRRGPAPKTAVRTSIITRVFSSAAPALDSAPEQINIPARAIGGRSVTPRFRGSRGTRQTVARVLDTPEVEVDTPLSTYGLRSRHMSHVNTPEPTFDIGHAAATSTPLFANDLIDSSYHTSGVFDKFRDTTSNINVTGRLMTLLTYLGHFLLLPFYGVRMIIYSFYDYGVSAYMKYTNFQPTPMKPIYANPADDPDFDSEANDDDALAALPWTTWVGQNISSAATIIKESFLGMFALMFSGIQNVGHCVANTISGVEEKTSALVGPVSKRFNWCNILGLLLALLLAIFLFGFLTSDNTAIRAKELEIKTNTTKAQEHALPVVPFFITAKDRVTHYAWMIKEYVGDIAFNVYNETPFVCAITSGPKYLWEKIGMGAAAAWKVIIATPSTAAEYVRHCVNSSLGVLPSSSKSLTEPIYNGFSAIYGVLASLGNSFVSAHYSLFKILSDVFAVIWDSSVGIIFRLFGAARDGIAFVWNSFVGLFYNGFSGIAKLLTSAQKFIFGSIYNFGKFISDSFYTFIYNPIFGTWNYVIGNYKELLKPVGDGFKYLGSQLWTGTKILLVLLHRIYHNIMLVLTWPLGMFAKFWIHVMTYAPEEVIQTIPLPQAITPTPLETIEPVEKATEVEEEEVTIQPAPEAQHIPVPIKAPETPIVKHQTNLIEPDDKKAIEIEEEEPSIHPAPAPVPIPVPNKEPAMPVVIHQTNVVETVDKEAIVKEVTEKLRAELSAQFHDELSVKFEQNYNALIDKLRVQNTNIQIDNAHLEMLIRQMIYEYDTDKTGQVDYALESSGGAVVSTRCSETYKSYTRLEKFWDIPIYYHHYSPRVVIQRNSKSLFPGECWCFKENRGYIAVELSHFIDVSSISYEHIPKAVAPEGNRSSAPKNILVWAYKQIDDLNTRVLLGDYSYDLNGPPLQFFITKHKPDFPVKFVELEVTSNYDAAFTCLYRLRVHGTIVKTPVSQ